MTKAGVIVYGRGGAVAVHFSESDYRAHKNTQARFKRIGYEQ